MIANSISLDSLHAIHEFSDDLAKTNYSNSHEPATAIYRKAKPEDAPYSVKKDILRGAIGIPSNFEYGKGTKRPVILVPGTASMGGLVYASNYAKLLRKTDFADVVWLNFPNYLLDDSQINGEYVAYAINYISGITNNKNLSIISWSQGGTILQWAFKYWPSTISKVDNFIPLAPDLKGSDMTYTACPSLGFDYVCTPSVKQVSANSYIRTLNDNDGYSAYVPTTSIYSGFDDLVLNEEGTNASSYIHDVRRTPSQLKNITLFIT